jgi:hypothetical protein
MSSYLHKIEAERTVLRMINDRHGNDSLRGLSAAAIARWAQQKSAAPALVAEVSELGRLIGVMCERSGERDSGAERIHRAKVSRAVRQFRAKSCR